MAAPTFQAEVQAMMYTFGDARGAPPADAALLVEALVRERVLAVMAGAMAAAERRGARSPALEDIVFVLRRDRALVRRIATLLGWKDLRRKAKADPAAAATATSAVKPEDGAPSAAELELAGPVQAKPVRVGFDLVHELTADVGGADDDPNDAWPATAAERAAERQRLVDADALTRGMTQEEYLQYTECRQATFIGRNTKRFRDWIWPPAAASAASASASPPPDRPSDDVVEVLGHVAWDWVGQLTRGALLVMVRLQQHDTESGKKRQRRMVSEPRPSGLFAGPEPRLLLLPEHVREYLRRLHDAPAPLDAFRGGRPRLRPRLGPL